MCNKPWTVNPCKQAPHSLFFWKVGNLRWYSSTAALSPPFWALGWPPQLDYLTSDFQISRGLTLTLSAPSKTDITSLDKTSEGLLWLGTLSTHKECQIPPPLQKWPFGHNFVRRVIVDSFTEKEQGLLWHVYHHASKATVPFPLYSWVLLDKVCLPAVTWFERTFSSLLKLLRMEPFKRLGIVQSMPMLSTTEFSNWQSNVQYLQKVLPWGLIVRPLKAKTF